MQNQWNESSVNEMHEGKHRQQPTIQNNIYDKSNSQNIFFESNCDTSVSEHPAADEVMELRGKDLLFDLGDRRTNGAEVGEDGGRGHRNQSKTDPNNNSNGDFMRPERTWVTGDDNISLRRGGKTGLFSDPDGGHETESYYNNQDTYDSSNASLTSVQRQLRYSSGVGLRERQSSYDFVGFGRNSKKKNSVDHLRTHNNSMCADFPLQERGNSTYPAPPGLGHDTNRNNIISSDSSCNDDDPQNSFNDGLGLRRPASMGLIPNKTNEVSHQNQLKKSRRGIKKKEDIEKDKRRLMESLGLIQSDDLGGDGVTSITDRNSIMDWLEVDFPNLSLKGEKEREEPTFHSSNLAKVKKKSKKMNSPTMTSTATMDDPNSKSQRNKRTSTNVFHHAAAPSSNAAADSTANSTNNVSQSQEQAIVPPFNTQPLYKIHNTTTAAATTATTNNKITSSPSLLQKEVSQNHYNGASFHEALIMEQTSIADNKLQHFSHDYEMPVSHQSSHHHHQALAMQSLEASTPLSSQLPSQHDAVHTATTHSNYDSQRSQTIYCNEQHNGIKVDDQTASINPPLPQVIHTDPSSSTTTAAGSGPIYLNSVPAYGGYTMAYYHPTPGHAPLQQSQLHHQHYPHKQATVSNQPTILQTPSMETNGNSPSTVTTTAATHSINSEFISLPIQHHGTEFSQVATTIPTTNGPFVYWQQTPTALNHHHHHLSTMSVMDSSGRPTTVTLSSIPIVEGGGGGGETSISRMVPTLSLYNNNNTGKQHIHDHQHHRHGVETGGREYRKGDHAGGEWGSSSSSRMPSNRVGKKSGRVSVSKHTANCLMVEGGMIWNGSNSGSSLLDEFHTNKNRVWMISDIKGHIVEFCQDQNGSRFIQQRLEVASDGEKRLVLEEVIPTIRQLRNDVFANYVVQKLFDHSTSDMKCELKKTLEGEMVALSTQMYGCRVVQKALQCLDDSDEHQDAGNVERCDLLSLLEEFHGHVIACIHDQNGNHVIQKCIEVISKRIKRMSSSASRLREKESRLDRLKKKLEKYQSEMKIIVDCVLKMAPSLSCHPYGCRVLQRILEHCPEDLKIRALDTILHHHKDLLDDQYGNYVIQHVLQFGRDKDKYSILGIVTENGLLQLSRQKFASNVVEKLLKYGNSEIRNNIVRQMLKVVNIKGTGDDVNGYGIGSSVVLLMVQDAYANYVVQTTLDVVSEGREKRLLVEELNKNAVFLRNFTFAKHIVTKLGGSSD